MKKHLLILSSFLISVSCAKSLETETVDDLMTGADTENQSDLYGEWAQNCQPGAFTGGGFAMVNPAPGPTPEPAPVPTGDQGNQEQIDQPDQEQNGGENEGNPGGDQGGGNESGTGATLANQNVLTITSDTMTLQTQGFETATCSGESLIEAKVILGYKIANFVSGQNTPIDLTLNSAEVTVKNEAAVANANNSKLCGLTDWKLNESKKIAGTNCLPQMPAQEGASILQILNYQNEQLLFGTPTANEDGTNGEDRPSTIGTVPFSRNENESDGNPEEAPPTP